MASLPADLRFALRLAWKNRGFSAAAILTLALGIGANTAIFSVVNSVLLHPLPYRDGSRFAMIWETDTRQPLNRRMLAGPNYIDFRDRSKSFEDMALVDPASVTITGFGEPQEVASLRVTASFLRMLGCQPLLGRNFTAAEGRDQQLVILSHGLWQRYYGTQDALGRSLQIDDVPYTVIGILPPNYWFPLAGDLLFPSADPDILRHNRNDHRFTAFGALKPGASVQQANAELNAIERRIGDKNLGLKDWATIVVPMAGVLAENVRTGLLLLLASVGLVLLIACANLANLMLVRVAGHTRESAVRLALGAGRARLIRQFLTETAVLALAGGAAGLTLACWAVNFLNRIVPQTFSLSGGAASVIRPAIRTDGWALAFTFGASVATVFLFGLAPAIVASGARISDALKESGRSPGRGRNLPNALAVSEVALALVLLIAAALVMKSFWKTQQVDPGFTTDHVLAMDIKLPANRTWPEQADFFRRVLESVRSVPLIRSAAIVSHLPLDPTDEPREEFEIAGRVPPPSGQWHLANYRAISAGYFRTMGIPLLRGRFFNPDDSAEPAGVVIINQTLARRYWSDGASPIGQRLRFRAESFSPQIIGVVGDVKDEGLHQETPPAIYASFLQIPEKKMTLVVRTDGDPARMIRDVKNQIWAIDKNRPVYKIRTLDEVISGSQSSSRFTLAVLIAFAIAALALAAAGIFGVISYAVSERTREIGIRIALGADRRNVVFLVAGQGTLLALIGVAAGSAGAFAATRAMSSLLFGVSPADPIIFTGAALFLVGVALLASYLPARRASRIDPAAALRCH